ncbi:MAG: hypothetical protein OXC26_23810 [Albidovulum sp.]|nr:hypothetical protein [Albidovulum sp.]
MAALNKRILCFVDECGTAGEDSFAIGCVMVLGTRVRASGQSFLRSLGT